jgi:hypothetical protein
MLYLPGTHQKLENNELQDLSHVLPKSFADMK